MRYYIFNYGELASPFPLFRYISKEGILIMEDFALGTVLFLVYFCFYCWLFCTPTQAATSQQEEVIAPAQVEQIQVKAEVFSPLEPTARDVNEVIAYDTPPQGVEEPVSSLLPSATETLPDPTLSELLEGIDLEKLQLRPARKIASQLGIAQKVNGKDQPLAWLRAQIKKQLMEKPEEAIPVIKEVLNAA